MADVTRPGYELRYRSRTATHYVAVFQVGDDRLAVCRKAIDVTRAGRDVEVQVTDVWGNDVAARGQPRWKLTRQWDFGIAQYTVVDGELIAIRPDFRGRMRIVFESDTEPDDPRRLGILDFHIWWGPRPMSEVDDPQRQAVDHMRHRFRVTA